MEFQRFRAPKTRKKPAKKKFDLEMFQTFGTSLDSLLAWESVQITSQGPNINPWKFQTILENHVSWLFFEVSFDVFN